MKPNPLRLYPFAFGLALSLSFSMLVFSVGASASESSGQIVDFVGDAPYTLQVAELARRAGDAGAPKRQPWSGSYWPLHVGSIANPYNEDDGAWINNTLRKLQSFKSHYQKWSDRFVEYRRALSSGTISADRVREMAPSEKYDLYLGDRSFTFTTAIWSSLLQQHERIGKLALWEGSCHGWAAAATYAPRPQAMITVPSLDGKHMIPFYPDDLKALSTLLWSNSLVQDQTLLLGNRCRSRNPEFDLNSGKILNEDCQGVNAGDFHVAVLELVGARQQTFIINRVNNTQVWNQPISAYSLQYFHVATGRIGTLAQSIAPRSEISDRFRDYRSGRASHLVGVQMELQYVSERNPSHRKKDDSSRDKIKTLRLRYDLELDPQFNIVGGEWISSDLVSSGGETSNEDASGIAPPQYPGFIWRFHDTHPVAYSIADASIPPGPLSSIARTDLVQASQKASWFRYRVFKPRERLELRPQPLSRVVNELVEWSNASSRNF